jgi:prolyl-tRNA synthetase
MPVQKITKKSENISEWYNDLIHAAKLAEHGPSRGSIIFRPYGYSLWEAVQKNMDPMIKSLGAQNCYFPLFIPMSFLQKEEKHVEGFSPELAVVTHGGGEKLAEPLVVRPTSETIMYDAFSRWIQSFRDLPMAVNQWNNVVRWEKRPYLFLRTTEFLWQEGHTAHATQVEAQKMVEDALKMYQSIYQDYMGLFGYAGRKSESEKFPGADQTLTFEMLMPDGKVIQGCTSHNLGQNFAKVFNVQFQDENRELQYVWQTSWGFTTRSIGALILGHGDDNGLVLPPQIAPIQVVILPIISKTSDPKQINDLVETCYKTLEDHNVRVKIDDSDNSPGWKFNQAELEGIPLRIEIGANEASEGKVKIVRRDNKESVELKVEELAVQLEQLLEAIQKNMLETHKQFTEENTRFVENYDDFKNIMETTRGFIKAFWCEDPECETKIKDETKATTRCLPLDANPSEGKCIYCGKKATNIWIFGQSY